MLKQMKKVLAGVAALAAVGLGSAALAGAATSSTSAGATGATSSSGTFAPANMPAHGSATHEDSETAVTGDAASKAQAAAVKSLGGGTAGAVTTDYTQTGYEVTVTKSDGSSVEVHLDSSFNVIAGPGRRHGGMPGHGSAAHENAEKPVTGTAATNAQTAAVKAAGGGTAGAATTDYDGNGYEVTVTKSDGSSVEIHLDSAFNVITHGHGPEGPPALGA